MHSITSRMSFNQTRATIASRVSTRLLSTTTASVAALTVAFAAPALATSPAPWQKLSDKAIEGEIEFARGLARDWAFVDLAQGVLDRVAATGPSERMAEELALVRCELYAEGAKRLSDPKEVNAFIAEGISAYETYLDGNEDATNRSQAERGLVALSIAYARGIDNELEEAAGEEAEALRTKKQDVLVGAIERTDSLIDELESTSSSDRTRDQNLALWNLMLQKGDMWSRITATTKDPVSADEAINTYENLSLDAGLNSEFALRAAVGIGDVYYGLGDTSEALSYYFGMVDNVVPPDKQRREEAIGWSEMSRGEKETRFNYVELGIPGIQKTARATGQFDRALEMGMFMYNLYREEGFTLSVLGHEALLEIAQTLIDVGGFVGGNLGAGEAKWYATAEEMNAEASRRNRRTAIVFALSLVNQVAEANSSTAVSIKAGKLLDSINDRPDIEITASQMQDAAKAKYYAKDYDAALDGYYALLGRMDSMEQADRTVFGAATYQGIGDALEKQGRYLEAGLAYREAVTTWSDDELNLRSAKRFRFSIAKWGKNAGLEGTPDYEKLIEAAQQLEIEYTDPESGGSVDRILFTQGMKLLKAKKYDDAVAKFEQIEPGAQWFDPAAIRIGQALRYQNKVSDALKKFDWFINEYAADPANAPESEAGKVTRKDMLGKATYNAGFIEHKIATAVYKKNEDTARFQKVIDRLESYVVTYPGTGQTELQVQSYLVDSYAKLGQATEAAAIVAKMIAENKGAQATSVAAYDLYNAYKDRLAELVVVEGEERDDAAITETRLNAANAITVANSAVASPNYVQLRTEGELWLALGDYEKAKGPLEKLVNKFQDDEERRPSVIKFAIPNLAETLLELGDPQTAKDLLAPYVFDESAEIRLASRKPTLLMTRAMVGSIVGSGTKVSGTPGAGGTEEEFAYITKRLTTIEGSMSKYTCAWYEAKFLVTYAFHVWGKDDDRKRKTAKKLLDNILTMKGGDAQFSFVDQSCTPEKAEDRRDAERLGKGVLASRYRWLYSKTR